MNTTLDPLTDSAKQSDSAQQPPSEALNLVNSILNSRPNTLVLQPTGALDSITAPAFQKALENALEQVTDVVIVDLLWVNSTDAHGIAALLAGIQKATLLGKSISFQSMDSRTRNALEQEWNRLQEENFGSWSNLFEANLESFLDGLGHS